MQTRSLTLTVGQRVELRRRRRGLSRKVVANLVGRSEEWLRLVESGQRKLDSIEVLARLAEVLQLENPTDLIDWPTSVQPAPKRDVDDGLGALRRVIVDHPALRVHGTRPRPHDDVGALAAAVRDARRTWSTSQQRYSRLAETLPGVLAEARTARWQRQDVETGKLLVDSYHVARSLLAACGDYTTAATVADRAMGTSAQMHQPMLVASSAWHVATELLRSRHAAESHDYALAAARRVVEMMPDMAEATILSEALRLLAAEAAAVGGDTQESAALLRDARQAAADQDVDRETRGIAFGPVEVGITEMEIALAQHDPDQVLRLAPTVELGEAQALARRSAYHLCQAQAYVLRRDDAAATLALMKTAAISPEDLRYNPVAHQCLQYLIRRDNYLTRSEVGYLAELAGLPS